MVLRRVVFRFNQQGLERKQGFFQNKGKGKSQKRQFKEEAHPQSGLSASEAREEEGESHASESDDCSSSQ